MNTDKPWFQTLAFLLPLAFLPPDAQGGALYPSFLLKVESVDGIGASDGRGRM